MKPYNNLKELFDKESFGSSVTELLCNRRYLQEFKQFFNYCLNYIQDARNSGSEILLLSTAKHEKVGFEVTSFKGHKAHLSADRYIKTIRQEGINGINILLNCPLGTKINYDSETAHIVANFGNWAFGHMTPATEWGKILLGKEMGTELREIGLQLIEISIKTEKRVNYILTLITKLQNP